MGLRTVCIDTVNTTTVVVLYCILVYDILDLGPPMSEKVNKESQYSSRPLHPPRRGLGCDSLPNK